MRGESADETPGTEGTDYLLDAARLASVWQMVAQSYGLWTARAGP